MKPFQIRAPCAVCNGNENVHTMRIVVNNEDLMAPVCNKPTCRGIAHRNSASIDIAKTVKMPEELQHLTKKLVENRQKYVKDLTPKTEKKTLPTQEELGAKHKSLAGLQRVQVTRPNLSQPNKKAAVRDIPLRPAPANPRY